MSLQILVNVVKRCEDECHTFMTGGKSAEIYSTVQRFGATLHFFVFCKEDSV